MTSATLGTPARPSSDGVLIHYVDHAAEAKAVALEEASGIAFERCFPARPIRNVKGQTNRVGRYWSATTGRHVQFESHLESCWLTIYDFDRDVTDMAAQPFRLVGTLDGALIDHVPDFFLRRSGNGVVVDVRHDALQDDRFAAQAAATHACLTAAGIGYETHGLPARQWWANVEFLSGFRRTPETGQDSISRILGLADRPVPFRQLATFVGDPVLIRPLILHLCWKQDLVFDLTQRLNDSTLITARKDDT